jgi:hypothetical protein
LPEFLAFQPALHGREPVPLGPFVGNQLFRLNHGKIITELREKSKCYAMMANVPPLACGVLVLMGFNILKCFRKIHLNTSNVFRRRLVWDTINRVFDL